MPHRHQPFLGRFDFISAGMVRMEQEGTEETERSLAKFGCDAIAVGALER